MSVMSEYSAAEASDHMLTCGPCNGQPGTCTDPEPVCATCGKPAKRPPECRSCAIERWRNSR